MFLLALALRLVLVAFVFRDVAAPTIDHERFGWEMGWTARSIALGHGFSSPFLPFTGPTALVPPLFPYLLAGVFQLFGLYSAPSALVILSLNSLFSALTCLPIFFTVRKTAGQRTALFAGFFWAIYPYAIYFSADRVWDYALTGFLLSLCLWSTQSIQRGSGLPQWLSLGLLLGLTALSNPSVITFLPVLVLLALFRTRTKHQSSMLRAAVTAGVFLAVIGPWCLRNHRAVRTWNPVRDGFWLEAYAGNNGDTFESNPRWAHPASNPNEMRLYRQSGETLYMEQKKQLTIDWVKAHPLLFTGLSCRRIFRFWTGFWSFRPDYLALEPLDLPNVGFATALTFFMLVGLRQWWRHDRHSALGYLAMLVIFPLPYYVTHASPDYRQPIEPAILILVTAGIVGMEDKQSLDDHGNLRRRTFTAEEEADVLVMAKA